MIMIIMTMFECAMSWIVKRVPRKEDSVSCMVEDLDVFLKIVSHQLLVEDYVFHMEGERNVLMMNVITVHGVEDCVQVMAEERDVDTKDAPNM